MYGARLSIRTIASRSKCSCRSASSSVVNKGNEVTLLRPQALGMVASSSGSSHESVSVPVDLMAPECGLHIHFDGDFSSVSVARDIGGLTDIGAVGGDGRKVVFGCG